MISDHQTAASNLLDMVVGFAAAQVIAVAARLGIADQLAQGAMTSSDLAVATGTHAPSMYRLLRALACLNVVTDLGSDRFELAPGGAALRSDAPDSVRALTMMVCGNEYWRSWAELEYSVRTGKPAWDQVTGVSAFEFFAQHPEQSATFNAGIAEYTRWVAPAIVAGYDFSRFGTLVDVGGGNGTTIAAVLNAVPGLRGILFDLPTGVEPAAKTLAAAGVADRCQVVTGDVFTSVPEGADAYLLKNVLHNWEDEQAVAILRSCRRAMPAAGTLLVAEQVLPPRVESPEVTNMVLLSDLGMLLLGGRERTAEEFRALFTKAGLELTAIIGVGNDLCVIEGSPG